MERTTKKKTALWTEQAAWKNNKNTSADQKWPKITADGESIIIKNNPTCFMMNIHVYYLLLFPTLVHNVQGQPFSKFIFNVLSLHKLIMVGQILKTPKFFSFVWFFFFPFNLKVIKKSSKFLHWTRSVYWNIKFWVNLFLFTCYIYKQNSIYTKWTSTK